MAFELHSQMGFHCIAGKVNHKLVPLSHKLKSGDQVEVLTSQSQTPNPEWLGFLATAKARTRLRAALRRNRQPVIDRGHKIFETFLAEQQIQDSNEVVTKILGTYKMANREELYLALGNEEVVLDDSLVKSFKKNSSPGLLSKIFGRGKNDRNDPAKALTAGNPPVNPKQTYILRNDRNGANFRLGECCNPIPGDDVMGFIEDDNTVTVHALTCPRAQVLKASYGPRIVATKWAVQATSFLANVRIEGIDRHGILQELISMISTNLELNIRSLNIEARDEVFHCDLAVLVEDVKIVSDLCNKVKKINGVKRATRVL